MDVVLEGNEASVKNGKVKVANKSGNRREGIAGEEKDHVVNGETGSENEKKKDDGNGKESGGRDDNNIEQGKIDRHGDGRRNQAEIVDGSQQLVKEDTANKQTENKDRQTQSGNKGETDLTKRSTIQKTNLNLHPTVRVLPIPDIHLSHFSPPPPRPW